MLRLEYAYRSFEIHEYDGFVSDANDSSQNVLFFVYVVTIYDQTQQIAGIKLVVSLFMVDCRQTFSPQKMLQG